MKQRILFLLLLMIGSMIKGNAQLSSPSSWKEVKVGDKMPDIPLGTVVNNVTGKKRFSDFKGKLIILDFWDSGCSSCIAAWPHMSELQEKYKGKIQVFLVNHEETQKEIEDQLANIYKKKKIVYPANLPVIVSGKRGDNILDKLFPRHGETGYHIWIDGKGIVRLRGNGRENTYEEKIEDLLSGKPISYVSDEGVNKYENGGTPLYLDLANINRPVVQYDSTITRLTEEIASYFGTTARNIYDSSNGTVRNSFLNQSIEKLYYNSMYSKLIDDEWIKILNRGGPIYSQLLFPIKAKDQTVYTGRNDSRNIVIHKPDEWRRQHCYSYEQIVPASFSEEKRRQYMLDDLNRYFGEMYGIEGKLEKITTDCWLIVNTTNNDKIKTKTVDGHPVYNTVTIDGKEFIEFTNFSMFDVLEETIYENREYFKTVTTPIINAIEYNEKVDVVVPKQINSIEAFQKVLQSFGLDMIKSEKELTRIVIKEKGVGE